ncbi:MAG: phage protease [Chloroflexota bacterium]|nr:phage protease [Chloroflexota bacterium]
MPLDPDIEAGNRRNREARAALAATTSPRTVVVATRPPVDAPAATEHFASTTVETPTGFVPKTIRDALGLVDSASADDVLRAVNATESAARASLTADEIAARDKIRAALGLAQTATYDEVVAALSSRLIFARRGGRQDLVFADTATVRREYAIAKSILTALGLPDDAAPEAVIAKVTALEAAQKAVDTEATNEAHALDQLRNLLGLAAGASDDDVVAGIRTLLEAPELVDKAILARQIHPSQRLWWEERASKDPASFCAFVATAPRGNVRADEVLADLANERVRWSRGRLDFAAAMDEAARARPELAHEYERDMQRRTRTNST